MTTRPAEACGRVPDVHRWVDGELSEPMVQALTAHVVGCPRCAEELAWLLPIVAAEEEIRAVPFSCEGALPQPVAVARRAPRWVAILLMVAAIALLAVTGAPPPSSEPVSPVVEAGSPPFEGAPTARATAMDRSRPPLYAPIPLPILRHLPHRAPLPTPPGGVWQLQALLAARSGDCAEALHAVQQGMAVSPDHAALYREVWSCFDTEHNQPLWTVAHSWSELAPMLVHFDGGPANDPPGWPAWAQPPVGGVELRLEALGADDGFAAAMASILGTPRLADAVASDLMLVASAASGLARAPPASRTRELEAAWARRTYALARALQRLPARLLRDQRPDVLTQLRGMLDEATSAPAGEGGTVPAAVLRAVAVAEGRAPMPEGPRPTGVEPPMDGLFGDEDPRAGVEVYRR